MDGGVVQDVPVGFVSSASGLAAIHESGCGAAIWHRCLDEGFQSWIDACPPEQLPRTRQSLRPDGVRAEMVRLLDACGWAECAARETLADDVAKMATVFAGIMSSPYVRLRLDAISTNACRKFHVDAVKARLICTYRGRGTQYGVSTDGKEPHVVSDVPTGAPMILRGTLWPGAASRVLHRSPPIEGTGETRLVLVLDPVADLEADDGL
ncbi:MAG: DUF1826 domain-containing protein, partial [Pseudomonadota bacterium]